MERRSFTTMGDPTTTLTSNELSEAIKALTLAIRQCPAGSETAKRRSTRQLSLLLNTLPQEVFDIINDMVFGIRPGNIVRVVPNTRPGHAKLNDGKCSPPIPTRMMSICPASRQTLREDFLPKTMFVVDDVALCHQWLKTMPQSFRQHLRHIRCYESWNAPSRVLGTCEKENNNTNVRWAVEQENVKWLIGLLVKKVVYEVKGTIEEDMRERTPIGAHIGRLHMNNQRAAWYAERAKPN